MMITDLIKPISIVGYNCVDNAVASIFNVTYDYCEIAYIDSWRFDYELNKNTRMTLGEKLGIDSKIKFKRDSYIQYFNFDINFITDFSIETFDNLLFIGHPIPVIIDEFYCPWKELYKKEHIDHCFTIISKCNNLYCGIDSIPINNDIKIDLDHLKLGYIGHLDFRYYNSFQKKIKIDDFLKGNLNKNLNYCDINMFNRIRHFSKDVSLMENFTDEVFNYSDPRRCPLFAHISEIFGGRIQYQYLLNNIYAQCQQNEVKTLIVYFDELIKEWNNIKLMIFKSFFIKEPKILIKAISEKLYTIADKEEDINNYILNTSFCGHIRSPHYILDKEC